MRPIHLVLLAATGCVINANPNDPPSILWAEVTCSYDEPLDDWIWTFDAEVFDRDGADDVRQVEAQVFDDRTGRWVDAFALERTADPEWWGVSWVEADTALFCGDRYAIDFIATDWDGATDLYGVLIGP